MPVITIDLWPVSPEINNSYVLYFRRFMKKLTNGSITPTLGSNECYEVQKLVQTFKSEYVVYSF